MSFFCFDISIIYWPSAALVVEKHISVCHLPTSAFLFFLVDILIMYFTSIFSIYCKSLKTIISPLSQVMHQSEQRIHRCHIITLKSASFVLSSPLLEYLQCLCACFCVIMSAVNSIRLSSCHNWNTV